MARDEHDEEAGNVGAEAQAESPKIDGLALVDAIPSDWREPTEEIARVLNAAGQRAWIVGGGVRDLLLVSWDRTANPPKDIDMVSAALPGEVEGLFSKTVAVGKSFGIIVVVLGGKEIELATFREERGYSDRRHPDEIRFATSPAVDACRRDFTFNAIYLDPLTGEIQDPTGGVRDLERGVLRTVGEPRDRFAEDGLRILRMARFAARFNLKPEANVVQAAKSSGAALEGVSPERVLAELVKMIAGPNPGAALRWLDTTGAADATIPRWTELTLAQRATRIAALEALGSQGAVTAAQGLTLTLWGALPEDATEGLEALRSSRDTINDVRRLREIADQLRSIAEQSGVGTPAGAADPSLPTDAESLGALVELARAPLFAHAAVLETVRLEADGAAAMGTRVAALASALSRASAAAPATPTTLASKELMELGVPAGPALGALILALRHSSLGGAFDSPEGARSWVLSRLGLDEPS